MPNYDSISVEEYAKALESLPDWSREILVLQFQCPRHEITAGQLARYLEYQHFVQGNQFYGNTARLVCEALNVAKPPSDSWWESLSTGYRPGKFFIWTMRSNLIKAIKQSVWLSETKYKTLFLSPEEQATTEDFVEGKSQLIAVNVFERNVKAREACLRHYGFSCSVCNFDFEKFYGKIGRQFIHVHHLKPLSEIEEEYKIDPIKDLRPVCPNCHAMLHRKMPTLTIDELKKII